MQLDTKIFMVDIGSEYYKMGFSREDCSIFEKTPEGIYDRERNLICRKGFAQIVFKHLKRQLGDKNVVNIEQCQIFLLVAHDNDALLLSELFKSSSQIKGILFCNPDVMDVYATGRTTGISMNLSSYYLKTVIITDSKVLHEKIVILPSRIIQNRSEKSSEQLEYQRNGNITPETCTQTKNTNNFDDRQTRNEDEELGEILKKEFDYLYNQSLQDLKSTLLMNVILCGGSITHHMVTILNDHLLKKSQNVKIILDHTIFSTYTGMDIISSNIKGFILRREWEEFGEKSMDKYGIEWYK